MKNSITLALTGASGAQYGLRLLQILTQHEVRVYCLLSEAAKVVIATEVFPDFPAQPTQPQQIAHFLEQRLEVNTDYLVLPDNKDWFSCVASGSSAPKKMVVCPCSMGSLAAIAHGMSDNLLERAADVILKERGRLVLVPREAPLSVIHLQNLLTLAQAGAIILPAAPGFYLKPRSIGDLVDSVVQRIIDQLDLDIDVAPRWDAHSSTTDTPAFRRD